MYIEIKYKGRKVGGFEIDIEEEWSHIPDVVRDYRRNGITDYVEDVALEYCWDHTDFHVHQNKAEVEEKEVVQNNAVDALRQWANK